MSVFKRSLASRLLVALPLVLLAAVGDAQNAPRPSRPAESAPVVERVFHLRRQPASAAVDRVYPLLSEQGSVAVRDGGRTLVVRDLEPIVERALELLSALDRDARTVRLTVQIVSAAESAGNAAAAPALELPPDVVERLRRLLRYCCFALLARADLEATEEVLSTFEVGPEFRVSFLLERQGPPERVRMREFRVLRRTDGGDLKPLVHTHLSLEVGRPMILGLSPTEASERALMVVLEAEAGDGFTEARG